MSRDPFDEMRRRNPAPSDGLPGAPMSVADRIVSGSRRAGMPGWVAAAIATLTVLVTGFGVLWFLRSGPEPGFADGGSSTTLAPATSDGVDTTVAVPVDVESVVYLFMDQVSEGAAGPFLVPVDMTGWSATLSDSGQASSPALVALRALLASPTPGQSEGTPALSSAIPSDTVAHSVEMDGGTAVVDLSTEFASGGGSFSMRARLAQVVYTLTAIDGVTGVRFEIEGEPTTVFGGEGVIVDDPATRAGFEDLLPPVFIETPAHLGVGKGDPAGTGNPLVVSGSANVFEATVSLALTDGDGLILWEGFATATCGTGCRGDWQVSIPYEVEQEQWGSLVAWEASAEDGRQTNIREHRVWLVPGGDDTVVTGTLPPMGGECSGADAGMVPIDDQEETLPAAVAGKRAAIWEAAIECDWEQLDRLLGQGFSYTFGADEDPIAFWQEDEARGGRPMYHLAGLLARPYGTIGGDGNPLYYVWPSAFGPEWADVPEADRAALRPLYDDEDFAFFAEFGGYVGYRVGILEDGTWEFFIAGD